MNRIFFSVYPKKIALKIILLLVLMICVIPESIFCEPDNSLKKQFETKVSEWIGVPVHVQDYRLEYATIHLSGVQIGDQKQSELPHGLIEKLSVSCDLMSLLGGKLILNDISLGTMTITLTRNQDGTFFPDNPSKTSSNGSDQSFADLPFLNLTGSSIVVRIVDKTGSRFVNTTVQTLKLKRRKDSDNLSIEFSAFCETGNIARETDASARLELMLALSGKLNKPDADGTVTIKNLKIHNQLLKQSVALDQGTIKILGRSLKIDDMSGSWGNSHLKLAGEVKNFDDFSFFFSYQVDPIMLEEFSQAFVSRNGITFSGKGTTSGTVSGSRKGFNLLGSLKWPAFRIEAPVADGSNNKYVFPFKNVSSNYSYNGRQMNLENASAEIFSGEITGSGKFFYRASMMNFAMDLAGSGLKTEQFLGENSSQKNTVSGPVDAIFKAAGDSSGLSSMNGSGSLNMRNGRYQAPPVVTPLLSMMNLGEFSSGEIRSGQGTFDLKSGILHTSDLLFVASAGKVYYQGQVGLDTSLKGKLNIIFTEESVEKSRVLQQISLDGKTAGIPSNVAGTLLSPSFPGFSTEKLLELGLKRTGQKILIDILSPGKKEPANSPAKQKEKSPQKIINDLKKIFKF